MLLAGISIGIASLAWFWAGYWYGRRVEQRSARSPSSSRPSTPDHGPTSKRLSTTTANGTASNDRAR